jgi:polyhydroxyalkanoate synthesis regulator phasin
MDERGNGFFDAVEQLGLAAVGAVSLTAEKADALADELAERGGMRRDEARAFVRDLASRWRGDAVRIGEQTGAGLHGAFRQLGLVLREEYEELELRVAQLEHRLRLLEGAEATGEKAATRVDGERGRVR